MKTLLKVSLIVFLIANFSYSQDAWEVQNSNTEEWLHSVYFLDEDNGWVVGANGTILNTVNGGEIWTQQNSGTTKELLDVQFVNDSTGWVVGDSTILYTKDFGKNWNKYEQDYIGDIKSVFFVDQNHGWICGYGDYILKTDEEVFEYVYDWDPIAVEERNWQGVFFIDNRIGWFFDCVGICKTEDGGYTIVEEYDLPLCNSIFFLNSKLGWVGQGWQGMTMGGPLNGEIKFTGDSGAHWSTQNEYIYIRSIIFFDEQSGLALGVNGGGANVSAILLKTTNGGETWESQSILSIEGFRIVDFYFCDLNTGWIVGMDGLIMRTTTGGFSSIPIEENIGIKEFKLSQNYPNPFNPSTHIKITLPTSENVTIKVYNLLGEEITTVVNSKLSAGIHTYEFDGSNFASGVYLYRIKAGEWTDVKKMLLIK